MGLFKKNPLIAAVEAGDVTAAQAALQAGQEDVNKKSGLAGKTVLHLACEKDDVAMVEALLAAGARVSERDIKDNTPLHVALKNQAEGAGGFPVSLRLIAAGADLVGVNGDGQSPFSWALRSGNEVLIAAMLKGLDVASRDNNGRSPLHVACQTGHAGAFAELLAKGAPIDIADSHGWTPLHVAAHEGSAEIVRQLIAKGASLEARTDKGATPVELVKNPDIEDKLRAFADSGLDLQRYHEGWTLLHEAVMAGQTELARALVKAGVPVDILSKKEGQCKVIATPLHIACALNKKEAARALIEHGADVNAVYIDEYGRRYSPMQVAHGNRNYILVSELEKAGGKLLLT